jgi:hypothetical protein
MSETKTEPLKKRRFWQLHLSTAVLLMIVSGLLTGGWVRFITPMWKKLWQDMESGDPNGMPPPDVREDKIVIAVYYIPLSVVLLFLVAVILEWRIRRREGGKP